ncbi:MAG TPA: hypothetical protein VK071_05360 [Tissierellales bacterium]|nr:hypothetical protein [Tissierellales bacterium]
MGEFSKSINVFVASDNGAINDLKEVTETHPNFEWSISTSGQIEKIRINKETSTEVISFTLNEDRLYFYYHEDLELAEEYIFTMDKT